MNEFNIDLKELLVRIIKYIFEGIVVAVAAFLIPGKKMTAMEIVTIGIISAATFSLLDLFAPSIGSSVRTGTGFAIGSTIGGGVTTGGMPKHFN
jgi:hypothetical protein